MNHLSAFVAAAILSLPVLAPSISPAFAADSKVAITDSYSYPTAGTSKTGAAFMTIANSGEENDRLMGASTPYATHVEIHNTIQNEHGVMQMRQIPELTVEPGKSVVLAPQGLHLMLMGLTEPLKENTDFPLTLKFEKAGDLTVDVHVQSMAAKESALKAVADHADHAAPVKAVEAPAVETPAAEAPAAAPEPATETTPAADPHAGH